MDPKDCFEPICEKDDPIISMRRVINKKRRLEDFDDEQGEEQEKEVIDKKMIELDENPIGKNTLGIFTWGLLHTMAIYYPDTPTMEQKQKMISFVDALAEFYPCKICRSHFQKDVLNNPPKVDSREELSIWMCLRHNDVNRILGKPKYDCKFSYLDQRWRVGFADSIKKGPQF